MRQLRTKRICRCTPTEGITQLYQGAPRDVYDHALQQIDQAPNPAAIATITDEAATTLLRYQHPVLALRLLTQGLEALLYADEDYLYDYAHSYRQHYTPHRQPWSQRNHQAAAQALARRIDRLYTDLGHPECATTLQRIAPHYELLFSDIYEV